MDSSRYGIVKAFYDSLNRNEVKTVLSLVTSDILRVETFSIPGIHTGLAEFEDHVNQGRQNWAEGGCHPEKMSMEGDRVLVNVHVLVRLKDRSDWIDGRTADVFTFRDDKIAEFHSFLRDDEAQAFISSNRKS